MKLNMIPVSEYLLRCVLQEIMGLPVIDVDKKDIIAELAIILKPESKS